MKKEVESLHKIIKDYRKEEGIGISKQRIIDWVKQFHEKDRKFILTELIHVFGEKQRYVSKTRAKHFLKGRIENLKKRFNYSTHKECLDNANFLDLQEEGKSQKELLKLLFEILQNDFNYSSDHIGCKSKKHNIYIDDVLCTGNTFFHNLKDWVTEEGEDRLAKLRSKKIDLIVYYMFIAKDYYSKKRKQFSFVSNDFKDLITVLPGFWLKKELLKPLDEDLSNMVIEYKRKAEKDADIYAYNRGFPPYDSDFYRDAINSETFYSSMKNRKRLESIFLKKGVEILNNSNVSKTNVRPLGYSLPSYKDFGFGALIFTWRNVANNTPLVFWYKSRDFTPLFENKR